MSEVMGRLEERERNHEATLVAMEKDIALKQQAMEAMKRKVSDISFPLFIFWFRLRRVLR